MKAGPERRQATWDVFISYPRDEEARAVVLKEELETFGLRVFLDTTDIVPGQGWQERLRAELSAAPRRLVVKVLGASTGASTWVAWEEGLALEAGHVVLPLRLRGVDVDRLTGVLTEPHHLDAEGWRSGEQMPREVRRGLLRAAAFLVRRLWERFADEAGAWARQTLEGLDRAFDVAPPEMPSLLQPGEDYALVAPGGAGKTVLLARAVLRHLAPPDGSPPRLLPILVSPETLSEGWGGVARRLGFDPGLGIEQTADALNAFANRNVAPQDRVLDPLFVIDALDTLPDGAVARRAAGTLAELGSRFSMLASCRPEVWQGWFGPRVDTPVDPPRRLSPTRARGLAPGLAASPSEVVELFTLPLFADLAPRLDQEILAAARHTTDVLDAARTLIVSRAPDAGPGRHYLRRLARLQLESEELERPVPRARLEQESAEPSELVRAGRRLLTAGELVSRSDRSGNPGVRLRHDLLDDHNAVEWLLSDRLADVDRRERIASLLRRVHRGAGSAVLTRLFGAALDLGRDDVVDEAFAACLHVLDQKSIPPIDPALARGWGITYALWAEAGRLAARVVAVLGGRRLDTAPTVAALAAGGSSPGPDAACTQETASTLGSVFAHMPRELLPDPARAVPVLIRAIGAYANRGRLVEALGRYSSSPDAVEELVRLARTERGPGGKDRKVLGYVVTALGQIGAPECLAPLILIHRSPVAPPRPARLAAGFHDAILAELPIDDPCAAGRSPLGPQPITDEEFIDGLRPDSERDRERWSDWRLIREYAGELRLRISEGGRISAPVFEALVGALEHPQSNPRAEVVRTLARHPDLEALEAVVDLLFGSPLPADLEGVVLEELRRRVNRGLGEHPAWERTRVAAAAAALSELGEAWLAQELAGLTGGRTSDDLLATAGARELAGPAPPTGRLLVTRSTAATVDVRSAGVREQWGEDVGPDLEEKWRAHGVRREADGALAVLLTPSSWTEGAGFLKAMPRAEEAAALGEAEPGLAAWLRRRRIEAGHGWSMLPGLAVVHAVALLPDGRLLVGRRSANVGFVAGAWSASYEEQLTTVDMEASDPFAAAARRGLVEEFGLAPALAAGARVEHLAPILEEDTCNLAIVCLVRLPEGAWERRGVAPDEEIVEVALVEPGEAAGFAPLHPTAPIRLRLLERYLSAS